MCWQLCSLVLAMVVTHGSSSCPCHRSGSSLTCSGWSRWEQCAGGGDTRTGVTEILVDGSSDRTERVKWGGGSSQHNHNIVSCIHRIMRHGIGQQSALVQCFMTRCVLDSLATVGAKQLIKV